MIKLRRCDQAIYTAKDPDIDIVADGGKKNGQPGKKMMTTAKAAWANLRNSQHA